MPGNGIWKLLYTMIFIMIINLFSYLFIYFLFCFYLETDWINTHSKQDVLIRYRVVSVKNKTKTNTNQLGGRESAHGYQSFIVIHRPLKFGMKEP